MGIPFLSATWRNLICVNYEVDPALLAHYLPSGTELDTYQGKALVSIVAFYFDNNKFLGIVPTYPPVAFEEINLRFYVIRREGDIIKRGAVFIKEVVPSRIIAWTARFVYNEPYERWPTTRSDQGFDPVDGGFLSYRFDGAGERYVVSATTTGPLQELAPGSPEEFILEHYWGYTPQSFGLSEYQVTHPAWRYWHVRDFFISENFGSFYGGGFVQALSRPPHSVFVAQGSGVTVKWGKKLYVPPRGWVLYDGGCGLCSRWISFLKPILRGIGFECASLQSPWVVDKISIPAEKLSDDIRLLCANGKVLSGAVCYRYLMKRIWWSAPLGYLCEVPGVKGLMNMLYAFINKNRFRISKVCGLTPDGEI
jgi:uncharacterized protein YqjF (DUF2071 family)/predicted DCC family thiol-disulfide oxidoreductase YuxK